MGRTREFSVEAALQAAVSLFWAQGYAATSVRQLCDAMGIQPGSFYATFQSKEACFRQAVTHYLRAQGIARKPCPEAIRAWFDAIVAPARRGKGCLLVNAAVEYPNLDADSRRLVAERLEGMEAFFSLCLGERPHAKDDAALLAAAVLAVHVLSRSEASPARLRRVSQRVLALTGL